MNIEDSVTTLVKQTQHGRQVRQPITFWDQDCLMASIYGILFNILRDIAAQYPVP